VVEQLRLMCVHAHPDDESSKGAATMARYAREGVDVLVVTLTDGSRGSVLNPAMDRPEVLGNITAVRAAALVRVVRQQRPHVMTTYDENGGYPHPDHIRCHVVSVAAFEAAGDPDRFPDAGEPWQPSKLYYNLTFHKSRLEKLHDAMLAAKVDSPYGEWLTSWEDKPGDAERLTTSVPCAEFFGVRDAALIAHATQVDPTGRWFACPIELQQSTWPYEDFQLARSLVDTDLPEADLFAGVRDRVLA